MIEVLFFIKEVTKQSYCEHNYHLIRRRREASNTKIDKFLSILVT